MTTSQKVMPQMPQILRPETVTDALRLVDDSGEETKVIAGGTAMMLMMRAGLLCPPRLVSLDRVMSLNYVVVESDVLRLGAMSSLRVLERSQPLCQVLPTVTAAIGLVANHRVRQRATIGGNMSEGDYASDLPAVLASFGARVRVASTDGERLVPVSEFLVSYYETALDHNELVTEVLIPRPPTSARTTYLKYVSRSIEDRPCVGVAAYIDADRWGRCRAVRVAVAGATATPFILEETMHMLDGYRLDAGGCKAVADAYRDAIEPIEDARGSAAYRKHVTGELVRRALETALGSGNHGAFRL